MGSTFTRRQAMAMLGAAIAAPSAARAEARELRIMIRTCRMVRLVRTAAQLMPPCSNMLGGF